MSSAGGELARPPALTRLRSWVPDPEAVACRVCGLEFGMMHRKHHCRACGQIVCDGCSRSRQHVLARQSSGDDLGARVCDNCAA